jgi:hypothetical protein
MMSRGSLNQVQKVQLATLADSSADGAGEANRSTTIGVCPNTLEGGSEKPFYFVMCCSLRKFIVWNRGSGERVGG